MAGVSLPEISDTAAMSEGSPAVTVVVPLFNEEENVPLLQGELTAALSGVDYEIIFVDDGSADRTAQRIARDARIRVLRFECNAGQSAAIYAGLQNARGAVAVQRHASFHSRAGERRRFPSRRSRGEPSPAQIWPEQIRSRQPRLSRHHGHVRCALAALAAAQL